MSSTQEVGPIFGEGEGPAQMMLRSPTVIIATVGLWGMNIYFFRLFNLDYVRILNLDLIQEREQHAAAAAASSSSSSAMKHFVDDSATVSSGASSGTIEDRSTVPFGSRITSDKLIGLSLLLLGLLHVSKYVWVDLWGGSNIGAVFLFYAAVLFGIIFPISSTAWLRIGTAIVIQRTFELINPRCSCLTQDPKGPRPIPFMDVFFADAMCSLSKVFFDWGMLFHLAGHYPYPVPPSTHAILIPSLCAAIPYLIRARQCLIMHTVGKIKRDPKRYQHIMNAIKYATSIFPICLSAYQQTLNPVHAKSFDNFLVILLIINASYALWWDIVMDWGMLQSPAALAVHACNGGAGGIVDDPVLHNSTGSVCAHICMRKTLRFGIFSSACLVFVDTVLRFSWLLRFCSDTVFSSPNYFVLATQLLEVFRRALWNLLRVEWEHIKHQRAGLSKAHSDSDEEDESLVPLFPTSSSA